MFTIGFILLLLGLFFFRFRLVFLGKEVPLLTDSGSQIPQCQVKRIEKMGSGSQPEFSGDGSLIAYTDKVNGDYEVFLMNADGSSRRCLTCNQPLAEFKGKHKGKAIFYPVNNNYLLLSAENEHGKHGIANQPGIGDDHDFWIFDLETDRFWRLTHLPQGTALQYPRFSTDGTKLLWSQRYEKEKWSIFKKGREWGYWKMKLADFVITAEGPKLTNVIDLEPGGKGYYEPHGFLSGNNHKIIFTAMINPKKSAFYGEIYTYDLESQKLTNITKTDNIHYEMALYSPNGQKISFMSGPWRGIFRLYKSDLYLMDADGSNRLRLSYFNERNHPDYHGDTSQIQKETWHPDGARIMSAYYNHKTKKSTLFMITFEGACGKL